ETPPKAPRGRPFSPGISPNPSGRPRGSKNRATRLWEQMSDANAEEIIRIVLDLARNGDKVMLRACLDRFVPRLRERFVNLELPPVNSAIDWAAAIHAIRTAHLAGEITLSEAEGMARLVELQILAIEISHFSTNAEGMG